MNILAFDTATPACSVALAKAGQIYCRHEILPRQQSTFILEFVDSLLAEAELSLAAIDVIACGVGPGSFMGVRLAVSIAQGLGFAQNIPILPLSSLQVLAQTAYEAEGVRDVWVMWDARMQEIYSGHYHCGKSNVMEPVIKDSLLKPSAFELPVSSTFKVVGNGYTAYCHDFNKDVQANIQLLPDHHPQARAMIALTQADVATSKLVSAQDLEPVYLRSPV